mmetsp:Transcript_40038/g.105849  ORF Transcript_40038/g.105849 Transcript_40038/m.105849 type:complete len:353 (+) Transcript_40038:143-1201(+)
MFVATHTSTHEAQAPPDLIDLSDEIRPTLSIEEEWLTKILPAWKEMSGNARVRHLVHLGVPHAVQGSLWWIALSPAEDETSFERAAAQSCRLREVLEFDWDGSRRKSEPLLEDLRTVSADVPRTFAEAQRLGTLDAEQLKRTLDAIVAGAGLDATGKGCSARAHGYVQGIADVVAIFLMHGQPPWQAYGCLRALSSQPLLQPLLALDSALWEALGGVFAQHLGKNLPELAAHLDELGLVPSFYLPEWLVPLWCRTLCPEASALVLNLILIEGSLSLLRVALGVVSALSTHLLELDCLSDCRSLLSTGPRELSISTFRACVMSCAVEPRLCRPLEPWLEDSPDGSSGVCVGFR